ncbi:MAG: isocitrate lyase/phosphoenolpyruvate mutase family protein [Bacteroidota bacterium]
MTFKDLHRAQEATLICNVWDVESARIAQQLQYDAIGTSSAAIASTLGYEDGEKMSFQELAYIVGRITQSTNIPLTVDLEGGYSRQPDQIVEHIKQLIDMGVVGINLEDSIVREKREILPVTIFSKTLESICTSLHRQGLNMFLNVRTDAFLLGLPQARQDTIQRGQQYQEAGADGLFVPCVEKAQDIQAIADALDLPLNVMCMPNLPDFATLSQLGVKRISMGNFAYDSSRRALEDKLSWIRHSHSFQNLFA